MGTRDVGLGDVALMARLNGTKLACTPVGDDVSFSSLSGPRCNFLVGAGLRY